MRRVHVKISGRVQGVFFRATTREKARELGLSGWVKNLRDGRVEAVFEGGDEEIREILKFCREGPERASVQNISIDEEEVEGLEGFKVRR